MCFLRLRRIHHVTTFQLRVQHQSQAIQHPARYLHFSRRSSSELLDFGACLFSCCLKLMLSLDFVRHQALRRQMHL